MPPKSRITGGFALTTTSVVEHVVPNQATFNITSRPSGRILSVTKRGNEVVLCVLEDSTEPTHDFPFLRFAQGEALPTDVGKERYVASYESGNTLFHVFQAVSDAALEPP